MNFTDWRNNLENSAAASIGVNLNDPTVQAITGGVSDVVNSAIQPGTSPAPSVSAPQSASGGLASVAGKKIAGVSVGVLALAAVAIFVIVRRK